MSVPLGPAGWQPDPTGRYEYRYHNGTQWTADVSMGGQRFVDQMGVPAWQTGWAPTFASPARRTRGMAVAAFVVGLVSLGIAWVPFVFVLGAAGAVTAFVFGILGIRSAGRQEGYGRGFAVTGLVVAVLAVGLSVVGFALTRTVMRELTEFVDPGPHRVTLTRCEPQDSTSDTAGGVVVGQRMIIAEGTITNLDSSTHDYTINISFRSAGAALDSNSVSVDGVRAGATATFQSFAFAPASAAVTCDVTNVFGPPPFDQSGR